MTPDELQSFLVTIDPTCQPVSFIAETEPAWVSGPNPFKGRVLKLAEVNGMLGGDYGSCVARAHLRDAIKLGLTEFEIPPIEARKWGERVHGTPLVHHFKKGTEYWYLDFLPLRVMQCRFKMSGYFVDGDIEKQIRRFLRPVVAPKKVIWRNYRLDHLHTMKACGEVLVVS